MNRWAGPAITTLIVAGVAAILWFNREGGPVPATDRLPSHAADAPALADRPAGFREYPIGDEVNHDAAGLRIAAVWLPGVTMEGGKPVAGTDVIHLEADVHAMEGNRNGFARDEFVPYLKIAYEVFKGGDDRPALAGDLMPMVARDGLHYGANVAMPGPGAYRLRYRVEPPSAGGLGRHADPITGVAPWWSPFVADYEWDFRPPEASPSPPGN